MSALAFRFSMSSQISCKHSDPLSHKMSGKIFVPADVLTMPMYETNYFCRFIIGDPIFSFQMESVFRSKLKRVSMHSCYVFRVI